MKALLSDPLGEAERGRLGCSITSAREKKIGLAVGTADCQQIMCEYLQFEYKNVVLWILLNVNHASCV